MLQGPPTPLQNGSETASDTSSDMSELRNSTGENLHPDSQVAGEERRTHAKLRLAHAQDRIEELEQYLEIERECRNRAEKSLAFANSSNLSFEELKKKADTVMDAARAKREEQLELIKQVHMDALDAIRRQTAEADKENTRETLDLIQALHTLDKRYKVCKDALARSQHMTVEAEAQKRRSEAEALKEQIALHNQVSTSKTQRLEDEKLIAELKDQLKVSGELSRMLTQQRQGAVDEVAGLKAELATKIATNADYAAKVASLKRDLAAREQQLRQKAAEETSAPSKQDWERLNATKAKLEAELASLQASSDAGALDLAKANQECSRYKVKLENIQKVFELEQQKLARVRDSANTDRGMLQELRAKHGAAMDKNQALREEKHALEEQVTALEIRVHEFEVSVTQEQEDTHDTTTASEPELRPVVSPASNAATDATGPCHCHLGGQLIAMRNQLTHCEEHLYFASQDVDRFRARCDNLAACNADLHDANLGLWNEAAALRAEIEDLHDQMSIEMPDDERPELRRRHSEAELVAQADVASKRMPLM